MSELLDEKIKKRELLKHMIKSLHEKEAPEAVKKQLQKLLGSVPYGDVVKVEQELIAEGLPQEEIIKLCDLHTEVLKGSIDTEGADKAPPGHPVHTFQQENLALSWEVSSLEKLYKKIEEKDVKDFGELLNDLKQRFNSIYDVDKHYRRKENLLFPFLEKHDITGPPKVMWAKHDETREYIKDALKKLSEISGNNISDFTGILDAMKKASESVSEMIYKEENILLPMCMDTLDNSEWYEIYKQEDEIGYCLFDPADKWIPQGVDVKDDEAETAAGQIVLPSGSFSKKELMLILNTLPVDITFVDKHDTVRYFTQGRERIFDRNRAIIGRKVQFCHPPSSVDTVERILKDFRSGKQNSAKFWITVNERFIYIEYFALRDEDGNYEGTIEVSQDLTEKRKLTSERRLLNYD